MSVKPTARGKPAPPEIFVIFPESSDPELLAVLQENLPPTHTTWNELKSGGEIMDQLHSKLRDARVVPAVLHNKKHDWNPNVFYEVGFAHGAGRLVIPICEEDYEGHLPFDLKGFKCLTYPNLLDLKKKKEFIDRLQAECDRIKAISLLEHGPASGQSLRDEILHSLGQARERSAPAGRDDITKRVVLLNQCLEKDKGDPERAEGNWRRRGSYLLFQIQSVNRLRSEPLLALAVLVVSSLLAMGGALGLYIVGDWLDLSQPSSWKDLPAAQLVEAVFSWNMFLAMVSFGWEQARPQKRQGRVGGLLLTIVASIVAAAVTLWLAFGCSPTVNTMFVWATVFLAMSWILRAATRDYGISYWSTLSKSVIAGFLVCMVSVFGGILAGVGAGSSVVGSRAQLLGELAMRAVSSFCFGFVFVFFARSPWLISGFLWWITFRRPAPVISRRPERPFAAEDTGSRLVPG